MKIGHNSGIGATVAAGQLRAIYERWLRLEEEKAALSDDSKELFAEAKANGFDTKAMRAVFRDMTKDQAEKQEQEAIYDLYWSALNAPRAHPAPARVENIEKFPPKGASDGERESGEERPTGDEGNSGGGDHQDQRGLRVAPEERSEPEGDRDPAPSRDQASPDGDRTGAELTGEAQGLVLPVDDDKLEIPGFLQRNHDGSFKEPRA